jgi:hypothetical protein
MQTRWRTGKTIKTCDNEEKAILDCLKVCNSNLQALYNLELSYFPPFMEPTYTPRFWPSNASPNTLEPDIWNGYGDDCSPFQKESQNMFTDDVEVAPHLTYEEALLESLHLSSRAPVDVPMLKTRRPACKQSEIPALGPPAASFEPTEKSHGVPPAKDKLTVAGLLNRGRFRQLRSPPKRRFSDGAVGPVPTPVPAYEVCQLGPRISLRQDR